MVDLDTDEGFDEFNREVLSKGAAGVPSAYKDGGRCEIILDDEAQTISFLCPKAALHCVKRNRQQSMCLGREFCGGRQELCKDRGRQINTLWKEPWGSSAAHKAGSPFH